MTNSKNFDTIKKDRREFKIVKLDYTIQDPIERNNFLKDLIEKTPQEELTPKVLEKMSDYLTFSIEKSERKDKKILTENRLYTINQRETSYEGLCEKFENGENGIYNIISNLGKN